MNHVLNTPFMQLAFRWDIVAVFVITGALAVALALAVVLWLFSEVKWR